jgi:large subunit ribosomal protein L5
MHKTSYEIFNTEIVPQLQKQLGITNKHAVPALEKVTLNIGLGRAAQQASFVDKILPEIEKELAILCGQKPTRRGAKKSIAGFKVREGQVIGLSATLRGARMYDFVRKLTNAVYPRVRDFRGISLKNIDSHGNLNVGLKEQVVFPEISPENSTVQFGLQITLTTRNAQQSDRAEALYTALGFRFKNKEKSKPVTRAKK